MKMRKLGKGVLAAIVAASMMASAIPSVSAVTFLTADETLNLSAASSSSVEFINVVGTTETAYAEWGAVTNATGYNVYVDGTQIDSMLIRQYSDRFRADAVGLKAGNHTIKVVPVFDQTEDTSKAAEKAVTVTSYDRTGFAFDGTDGSCGAYNADGTLKDNAVVLYITEDTKDTVTLDVVTSSKGTTTTTTGLQNILNAYKKGYDSRPLAIRVVGMVTDPSVTESGDLVISGSGDAKRLTCGITVEGIGEDALFNGFGIRVKNISGLEIRNMGIMLVDSSEGDNYSLQQSCDHVWVHNCDSFYGMPGSDSDQAKGDGALDCKKSTYVTFSYNHFWDNGKCNLLGLSEGTTEGLYISYHHNWYDHSDSRHPRIRYYSAHVYNNYYDGNSKYGIGSTLGSSVFSENNYFRNCKYPMLTSMQGSDIATGAGTFSSEDGGTIKSYGNYIEGAKAYVTYQEDSVEFDAYEASSKTEQVPSSVTSKQGGNTYNNFDTSSIMYSYTADAAEDVPSIVMAQAGRLNGGDFQWEFDDAVDDESYAVNTALMAALQAYESPVIAIGSGFTSDTDPITTTEALQTTTAVVTTSVTSDKTAVATTAATSKNPVTTSVPDVPKEGDIFCSPTGTGSGDSQDDPASVTDAISKLAAGHTIYLLEGTYEFDSTLVISSDNNGTADAMKTIKAYNGADVVFDFSGQGDAADAKRGVVLDGDYWHFYGFEITKAADNGMLLSGNNNKIERMIFSDNQDTGLQLSRYNTSAATIEDWPSNNLILNCTSKNNCDDATLENADGFAAKLTCGEGNVFDGCLAYNNSDDGWDLYAKTETGPIGVITIQNCVAFRNGYTEFGEGYGDCDGNGFKLGGSGVGSAHVVKNCLAFENLNCGFTDNNNPNLESLTNCTSYNNGVGSNSKPNISCYRCTEDGCDFSNIISYYSADSLTSNLGATGLSIANDKFVGTIQNAIYYNAGYYQVTDKVSVANNEKVGTKGAAISNDDFVSVTAPLLGTDFDTEWRNADGSITTHGFMQLKEGSAFASVEGAVFEEREAPPIVTDETTTAPQTTTETKTTTTVSVAATEASTQGTEAETQKQETEDTAETSVIVTETTTSAVVETTEAPGTTASNVPVVGTICGDVNMDGSVNMSDVILLSKASVNVVDLTAVQRANADCFDDGTKTIDGNDAMVLLHFQVQMIDDIPMYVVVG